MPLKWRRNSTPLLSFPVTATSCRLWNIYEQTRAARWKSFLSENQPRQNSSNRPTILSTLIRIPASICSAGGEEDNLMIIVRACSQSRGTRGRTFIFLSEKQVGVQSVIALRFERDEVLQPNI